jgi:hypothetical protein
MRGLTILFHCVYDARPGVNRDQRPYPIPGLMRFVQVDKLLSTITLVCIGRVMDKILD